MSPFSILIIISFGFLNAAIADEEVRSTMDELETLAIKKQWSQAIALLPELTPADRTEKYEAFVEKVAIGYLRQSAGSSPAEAMDEAEALVKKFPSLSRSKAFEEQKYQIAFQGYEKCLMTTSNLPYCEKSMMGFVKSDRNSMELAFRAGKLLNRYGFVASAVPFFSMAISTVSRNTYCSDEDVLNTITQGLTLTDSKNRLMARELADRQCWREISFHLLQSLQRSPASQLKKEACALFRKKKEQSKTNPSLCIE